MIDSTTKEEQKSKSLLKQHGWLKIAGISLGFIESLAKIPVTYMALLASGESSIIIILILIALRFFASNGISFAMFAGTGKSPQKKEVQKTIKHHDQIQRKKTIFLSIVGLGVVAIIFDEIGNLISTFGRVSSIGIKNQITNLISQEMATTFYIIYTVICVCAGTLFMIKALMRASKHGGHFHHDIDDSDKKKQESNTRSTHPRAPKSTQQTNTTIIWICAAPIIIAQGVLWVKRILGQNISIGEVTNNLQSLGLTPSTYQLLSWVYIIFSTITFTLFLTAIFDGVVAKYCNGYVGIYSRLKSLTGYREKTIRLIQFSFTLLSVLTGSIFTIAAISAAGSMFSPEMAISIAIFQTVTTILACYVMICCTNDKPTTSPWSAKQTLEKELTLTSGNPKKPNPRQLYSPRETSPPPKL